MVRKIGSPVIASLLFFTAATAVQSGELLPWQTEQSLPWLKTQSASLQPVAVEAPQPAAN